MVVTADWVCLAEPSILCRAETAELCLSGCGVSAQNEDKTYLMRWWTLVLFSELNIIKKQSPESDKAMPGVLSRGAPAASLTCT